MVTSVDLKMLKSDLSKIISKHRRKKSKKAKSKTIDQSPSVAQEQKKKRCIICGAPFDYAHLKQHQRSGTIKPLKGIHCLGCTGNRIHTRHFGRTSKSRQETIADGEHESN